MRRRRRRSGVESDGRRLLVERERRERLRLGWVGGEVCVVVSVRVCHGCCWLLFGVKWKDGEGERRRAMTETDEKSEGTAQQFL